jgi:hypothetical protein
MLDRGIELISKEEPGRIRFSVLAKLTASRCDATICQLVLVVFGQIYEQYSQSPLSTGEREHSWPLAIDEKHVSIVIQFHTSGFMSHLISARLA